MPTELEIQNSIEIAKNKAISNIERPYSLNWNKVENDWHVSNNPHTSGINGKLYYYFIKKLKTPLEISFKDKWGNKHTGFVYQLVYQTGFSSINKKDIHAYSLFFMCESAQIDGYFYQDKPNNSSFVRTLTKSLSKSFTKNGIDCINLPDVNDFNKYPQIIK